MAHHAEQEKCASSLAPPRCVARRDVGCSQMQPQTTSSEDSAAKPIVYTVALPFNSISREISSPSMELRSQPRIEKSVTFRPARTPQASAPSEKRAESTRIETEPPLTAVSAVTVSRGPLTGSSTVRPDVTTAPPAARTPTKPSGRSVAKPKDEFRCNGPEAGE